MKAPRKPKTVKHVAQLCNGTTVNWTDKWVLVRPLPRPCEECGHETQDEPYWRNRPAPGRHAGPFTVPRKNWGRCEACGDEYPTDLDGILREVYDPSQKNGLAEMLEGPTTFFSDFGKSR